MCVLFVCLFMQSSHHRYTLKCPNYPMNIRYWHLWSFSNTMLLDIVWIQLIRLQILYVSNCIKLCQAGVAWANSIRRLNPLVLFIEERSRSPSHIGNLFIYVQRTICIYDVSLRGKCLLIFIYLFTNERFAFRNLQIYLCTYLVVLSKANKQKILRQ